MTQAKNTFDASQSTLTSLKNVKGVLPLTKIKNDLYQIWFAVKFIANETKVTFTIFDSKGAFLQLGKSKIGFLNPKRILRFLSEKTYPRSLGLWCIKGTEECLPRVDFYVPLTHHDPSDRGFDLFS